MTKSNLLPVVWNDFASRKSLFFSLCCHVCSVSSLTHYWQVSFIRFIVYLIVLFFYCVFSCCLILLFLLRGLLIVFVVAGLCFLMAGCLIGVKGFNFELLGLCWIWCPLYIKPFYRWIPNFLKSIQGKLEKKLFLDYCFFRMYWFMICLLSKGVRLERLRVSFKNGSAHCGPI